MQVLWQTSEIMTEEVFYHPEGGGLGLLLFNGTFSTNRLYRAIEVQCISRGAGDQQNHTIEQ